MTPESLVYVGEQTRFALRRDQITDARLIKGFPGWLPAPAIRIDWHAGESAPRDCFQLRNVERSMRQTARATRTLHAKIQEWREAGAAGAAGERFADLAPPAPATITSAPPPGGPGILVAGLITLLFLAFGVSLLLGLSFDFPSGGGLYVLGTAAFMALFQSLPFVVPRPRSVAAPPSSDTGSSPKTP